MISLIEDHSNPGFVNRSGLAVEDTQPFVDVFPAGLSLGGHKHELAGIAGKRDGLAAGQDGAGIDDDDPLLGTVMEGLQQTASSARW